MDDVYWTDFGNECFVVSPAPAKQNNAVQIATEPDYKALVKKIVEAADNNPQEIKAIFTNAINPDPLPYRSTLEQAYEQYWALRTKIINLLTDLDKAIEAKRPEWGYSPDRWLITKRKRLLLVVLDEVFSKLEALEVTKWNDARHRLYNSSLLECGKDDSWLTIKEKKYTRSDLNSIGKRQYSILGELVKECAWCVWSSFWISRGVPDAYSITRSWVEYGTDKVGAFATALPSTLAEICGGALAYFGIGVVYIFTEWKGGW